MLLLPVTLTQLSLKARAAAAEAEEGFDRRPSRAWSTAAAPALGATTAAAAEDEQPSELTRADVGH